jgi:acyl-homoserine lactone synthase
MDEHHRIRHQIYINELKWSGLTPREDEREYDQFDTADAVYLLGLDEGRVVCGTRLIPSTCPHLMSDVFPQFAAVKGVPRGPDIAEWTRVFVVPERREEHKSSKCGSSMMAAMMEYGLEEGLAGISVVMNTVWLPRLHSYEWRLHPLGLPGCHDREWLIAVLIDVTPQALRGIKRVRELAEGSLLVRRGPQRPLVREMPSVPAVA